MRTQFSFTVFFALASSAILPLLTLCAPPRLEAAPVNKSVEPSESLDRERFAALECQNTRVFAIINFYPNGDLLLTWGVDDEVKRADIPVRRIVEGDYERFTGGRTLLSLPIASGENSLTPRTGRLKTSDTPVGDWTDLTCLLHGAD